MLKTKTPYFNSFTFIRSADTFLQSNLPNKALLNAWNLRNVVFCLEEFLTHDGFFLRIDVLLLWCVPEEQLKYDTLYLINISFSNTVLTCYVANWLCVRLYTEKSWCFMNWSVFILFFNIVWPTLSHWLFIFTWLQSFVLIASLATGYIV